MGVALPCGGAATARDRGSRKLQHALCSRQEGRMYRIAGIDVHKRKLAVVVAEVEVHGEYQFERCWFAANPEQLRLLFAMAGGARSRRSGDGIYGALLETGMGS